MQPIQDTVRRNPDTPLKNLVLSGYLAILLIALGWVLAPNNLLLAIAMIAGVCWGITKARGKIGLSEHIQREQTRRRNFTFPSIPMPTDEDGKLLLSQVMPYWEPKDVCYLKIQASERIRRGDQVTNAPWYGGIVDKQHMDTYRRQEAFLKDHDAKRYRVVRYWWMTGYLIPALERRFPDWEFRLDEEWLPTTPGNDIQKPGATSRNRIPDDWIARCRRRAQGDQPAGSWENASKEWCQEIGADYQWCLFRGVRIALQPDLWSRRVTKRPSMRAMAFLMNSLLDLYSGNRPEAPAIPLECRVRLPRRARVYVGHGFMWDVMHAQGWYELSGQNLPGTADSERDGDDRIYALGWDQVMAMFFDLKTFNQHAWLSGMPGSGKTRFLQNILIQMVEAGFPIICVDPKGDRELLNSLWETARLSGREIDLYLFHLNAPRCPEISDFNPLYEYDDPAELAARVAAVVERTNDPFWFRVGMSTAKAVCMLSHYAMNFLRIIGSEFRDNRWTLASKFSNTPPKLLLAMQWRNDHPNGTPKEARHAIETFLANRLRREWTPTTDTERRLLDMCRLAFYSPKCWVPNLKPVNVFGISKPETMIAWALKIIYFHLWIGKDRTGNGLKFPDVADVMTVVGPDEHSWWNLYKRSDQHPLLRYFDASYRMPDSNKVADPFYAEFIPREAMQALGAEELGRWLRFHHEALRMMGDKARQERKEYHKHMSTLQASLANFEGEREDLVTSVDPEIVLSRIVRGNGIALFVTNYIKDKEASEGFNRTVVVDTLGYLGETYGSSWRGRYDFWLVADETATFITQDLVPIISQGRGAGVHALLAGQNNVDLEVALGSQAKAKQVMGNLGTKISLRTSSLEDAKTFSDYAGKCTIKVRDGFSLNTTRGYGHTGVETITGGFSQNINQSFKDRDFDRISPSILLRLPTGQAIATSRGAQYMLIQGQLPPVKTDVMVEYQLLRPSTDSSGAQDPAMMAQFEYGAALNREIAITNTRLTIGLFADYSSLLPAEETIPPELKDRFPQDRAKDLALTNVDDSATDGPPSAQKPQREGSAVDLEKDAILGTRDRDESRPATNPDTQKSGSEGGTPAARHETNADASGGSPSLRPPTDDDLTIMGGHE